jgi:hypothetical protein
VIRLILPNRLYAWTDHSYAVGLDRFLVGKLNELTAHSCVTFCRVMGRHVVHLVGLLNGANLSQVMGRHVVCLMADSWTLC